MDELSSLWDLLLSRQPELIENGFQHLSEQEQQALITHLIRMRDEEGWQTEQRISAMAALKVIEKLESGKNS